jgi:hypothetical protein
MPNEPMDIVEIQHNLGHIIADLKLLGNDLASVSTEEMERLSNYLADNQLSFEKALRNEIKDKGSEYYVSQLYRLLSSYLEWYVANRHTECDNSPVAKLIYDRIVFLWMPPIESIFPNVVKTDETITNFNADDKDPMGYNTPFEKAGEHYRSIRYDITENPEYPQLTTDEIYRRLKELIAPVCGEGVKIATILNIAIKYRLLQRKPQGKSLERELGMTCSYQAVTNVIENHSDFFNIDDWGKEMKAKLLK